MPVSEKQKEWARAWDKEHMRTLATRVRTEDAELFKEWCARQGVSTTTAIKNFVMDEIRKYGEVLEKEHKNKEYLAAIDKGLSQIEQGTCKQHDLVDTDDD